MRQLKALIIAGSSEVELLLKELHKEYELKYLAVNDDTSFSSALNEELWDIILVDSAFATGSGQDILGVIREKKIDTPVIILTEKESEDNAVKMMEAGACDYILKDNLRRLLPVVSREIRGADLLRESCTACKVLKGKSIADFIDFFPDAVFAVDLNGKVIVWNKLMEKLTDIKAEEIIGKANYSYALPFYGERRPMLIDLILDKSGLAKIYYPDVITEGDVYISEYEAFQVKGQKKTLRIKVSPLYDNEGNVVGAIESIWDKTNRKIANESMQRYNILFNQLREAVMFITLEGAIIDVNTSAIEYYGYTREEFLNLKIVDFHVGDTLDKVARLIKKAGKDGVKFEALHRRKDGSEFYAEVSANVIDNNKERILLSTIRDITERKKFEQALRQSINELERTVEGIVHALALTTEKRDLYTAGHQQRVANLAVAIAKTMGLKREKVDAISIAGSLHDIGKIVLPAEILTKPAKLTELEKAMMRTHCEIGYDIIKNVPFKGDVASIILQHHERLDGSGYPQGLKEDEILLEARILAVADVVEAMASRRPHRASLGLHRAVAELIQYKGILYDSSVVEGCLEIYRAQKLEKLIQTEIE